MLPKKPEQKDISIEPTQDRKPREIGRVRLAYLVIATLLLPGCALQAPAPASNPTTAYTAAQPKPNSSYSSCLQNFARNLGSPHVRKSCDETITVFEMKF